jgi:hypothetical protein
MEALAAVAAAVMALGLTVVVLVALVPWLRTVLRDEGDAPDDREPSPVDLRTLPYVLVTAASVAVVRELRTVPWSLLDALLPSVLLGFGVSAAWYLLRQRGVERTTWPVALTAAVTFGALWGLSPP